MEWDELNSILDGWLRWHQQRQAVRWGLRGLAAGLGAAVLAALFLLSRRLLLSVEFWMLAGGLALAGLFLAGATALLWRRDRLGLARRFDRAFGLRERVSTALDLHHVSGDDSNGTFWGDRQLADALAAAKQVEPWRVRPFRLEGRTLAAVLCLALILAALGYVSQPVFLEAQSARAVAGAIAAEKEQVANLIEEIQKARELSPEQKAALTQALKEAQQRLQDARTREQAVTALGEAEAKLRELTGRVNPEEAQALKTAGEQLAQGPDGSPFKEAGQALANGDTAKAAQSLRQLDPGSLTPGQRKQLADQLNQAGQTLSQSGSAAGQALRQAANFLAQGNTTAAQQALQQASQAIQQSGKQAALNQAAGQAANQLQQGQAAIAQAGQPAASGQGTAQGSGNDQNQANTNGAGGGSTNQASSNGTGSGSTNQKNQGQGGGGAGKGEGNGTTNPGGEAGSGQIAQNNSPGDGGEKSSEQIYAPQRLSGEGGPAVNLPGSGQPGGQVVGQQPSASGQPGVSQVPYTDVLPSYAETVRRAMDHDEIPAYLLPVIREYFSSLQP
ncbi:MAG TPA: hypothetical protein VMT46_00875 [Anaerolineaceae bacterium]|nr:hypothetical protein [Anaerolineaceae bacterium]